MTTTTASVTYRSSELGRTVVLATYVDPHPTLKGTDRVPVECGYCTNGVYTAPSGCHWDNGRGDTTWCFRCNGSNRRYISVTTARRNAKADAFRAEYGDELRAVRQAAADAANAAIAAAEFDRAWNAAHAEQARRASLVQGFLGEVDEKIEFTGTVTVASYKSGAWNRSSSMWLVFTADSGQVACGSSSSQTVFGLNRGDRVRITAKVKAVDPEGFRGQQQTKLTGIKAEVLEAAE